MTARDERNQRIRIGITGLAFIFLLVLVGTAITQRGEDPAEAVEEMLAEEEAPPADPLTEIGAAPGQGPIDEAAAAAQPADGDDVIADALRDDLAEGGAREDILEE